MSHDSTKRGMNKIISPRTPAEGEHAVEEATPERIPDLEPFAVDPLFLGRLHAGKVSQGWAAAIVGVVAALTVIWAAGASGLFLQAKTADPFWVDVWNFVIRAESDNPYNGMPYLRDYPSIVLTFTIVASVLLVYALYQGASRLHSDMEASGCIKYNEAGRRALTGAVNAVNQRLQRWGKLSPIALILALGFTTLTNLGLQSELFSFLVPGLYENWWASLSPLRAGGILWVVFGAIGIYMVYIEAVVGLTYVAFLKRLKNDYQFRANMVNPDGFFGWLRLRQLITNMQAGALCTMLSAWALSFFLEPAMGTIATAAILAIFIGIVLYVFSAVNGNFRRQVRRDKQAQTESVAEDIAALSTRSDTEGLLALLVSYQKLEHISKIPATPIRQRWLVAAALSILGPLSAIVIQVVKYFTSS
ncbi:hypothetical protein [Micromonospora sp. NPDC005710]|uniref:hypothetical protein n=1 Tax=Micromonospora sp. NPDC005710 TaxID=3157051 RepID=UPI0033E7911F